MTDHITQHLFQPAGSPVKHKVRTVTIDGEPWFIAKDVAVLLGYANPHEAIRTHCKGVRETLTPSAGGPQMQKIIPERDVYRLIMRSKLPAAEAFEEFVVGTILPSIRKTGSYVVGEELIAQAKTPEDLFAVQEAIQGLLERKASMLEDQVAQHLATIGRQEQRIVNLVPKADVFDAHVAPDDQQAIHVFARTLDGLMKKLPHGAARAGGGVILASQGPGGVPAAGGGSLRAGAGPGGVSWSPAGPGGSLAGC